MYQLFSIGVMKPTQMKAPARNPAVINAHQAIYFSVLFRVTEFTNRSSGPWLNLLSQIPEK